jgi:micrococcal nuclease
MTRQELEKGLYHYQATCDYVVDGDTVDLSIDLGLFIQRTERIRLYGINAPEMKGATKAAGQKSKEFVVKALMASLGAARPRLWIETVLDKSEKYGRLLGKIWYEKTVNGTLEMVCLNDELVDQGLAERRSY